MKLNIIAYSTVHVYNQKSPQLRIENIALKLVKTKQQTWWANQLILELESRDLVAT